MDIKVTIETPGGQRHEHRATIADELDLPDALGAAIAAFRTQYREPLTEYSTIRIERA